MKEDSNVCRGSALVAHFLEKAAVDILLTNAKSVCLKTAPFSILIPKGMEGTLHGVFLVQPLELLSLKKLRHQACERPTQYKAILSAQLTP